MKDKNNIQQAKKCLTALGAAYRSNWDDMDGRQLRSELSNIHSVLDGVEDYEWFCRHNYIDPVTHRWTN